MPRMLLSLCFIAAFCGIVPAAEIMTGPNQTPRTSHDNPEAPGLPLVLDLDAAKRIALAENPSIKAALTRIEQARNRVRAARSAYFPTISASTTAAKTWLAENDVRRLRHAAYQNSLLGSGQAAGGSLLSTAVAWAGPRLTGLYARSQVEDTAESYSASLSASWLLFDGFARTFSHAAARYGALEIEAAFDEARRLLLDAVAFAYYGVQLAREDIDIAEADKAFNQRQLKEAQARRNAGAGSLSDELNFRVRVNAARTAVIRATREYEAARIGLAVLLGIPDAAFAEAMELAPLEMEDAEDLVLPEPEPLINRAREQRPDLKLGRHTVQRARATVGARRGAFFPNVVISASKDASLTDADFGEDDFSTTVAVVASYDLFTGGRNRANYAEAKNFLSETKHDLNSIEIDIASEIRSAVETLRAAQEALLIQRENAEHVEKNRDLVEKGYAAGQESLVRLNEAQRDLIQARGNLALARVSLRQAWHTLRTATADTLTALP